jgi:hypothetical protein
MGIQWKELIGVISSDHSIKSKKKHNAVTWLQLQMTAEYLPWPFVVPELTAAGEQADALHRSQ